MTGILARSVVFGVAIALSAMAHAKSKTFDLWLSADVEIAADGTVKALEWQEETPAAKLIVAKIAPLVRTWEFVPGTVNGTPALTQTHLSVQVLGEVRDDDTVALKIGTARTGPASGRLDPPVYPRSAIMGGVSAEIVADVVVDASGRVAIRSIVFTGSKGDFYQKEFIAAAEAVIKTWKIKPEQVGGRAVAGQMRIPIEFCSSGNWCERRELARHQSQENADVDPRRGPVALESVARLVTQVSGQEI